jgi:hypothetical protein
MHLPPKEHLKIFFVPSLEVTLRLSPYGKGFMLLADPFKEDAYIPKGAQVFYSDVMIRSVR